MLFRELQLLAEVGRQHLNMDGTILWVSPRQNEKGRAREYQCSFFPLSGGCHVTSYLLLLHEFLIMIETK